MRSAIVSDLHLGSLSREDVLSDRSIRRRLLDALDGADRLVLLGDTVEVRDLPLAEALERARPFFEELGEAMAGREVLMLAGNHDHHFAEPLLEQRSLGGPGALGLENRYPPELGAAARVAAWLGDARLEMSYPGAWLRQDTYAMHGHYMDPHLVLPKAEAIGCAAIVRATRELPDPAEPEDYERVLRPIYGLIFGFAQSGAQRPGGVSPRPSERAWTWLNGSGGVQRRGRQLATAAVSRGALPAAVWTLNRVLGAEFVADLSAASITRAGIAGAIEAARRLRIAADHVIVGHSHRAGPLEGEDPWRLAGGGRLHNSGNWVFSSALHNPGSKPGPYWPGTLTWLEGDRPPRREALLDDLGAEELAALAGGRGRFRLTSLASRQVG